MPTETRTHNWNQITMTPVIMVEYDGEMIATPDPERSEETRIGCVDCNMGMDEGLTLPCPGFDIFDDATFE